MYNKSTPEIEIDIDIEKDIEKEKTDFFIKGFFYGLLVPRSTSCYLCSFLPLWVTFSGLNSKHRIKATLNR